MIQDYTNIATTATPIPVTAGKQYRLRHDNPNSKIDFWEIGIWCKEDGTPLSGLRANGYGEYEGIYTAPAGAYFLYLNSRVGSYQYDSFVEL